MSLENKYKYLIDAYPELLPGADLLIQKGRIANSFKYVNLTEEEKSTLRKAKELCELRIMELWNKEKSEEFKALCSTYFDIATLLDNHPDYNDLFIYEQIKITAFGYLGEHWHFVKQYLQNKQAEIDALENLDWSKKLLMSIYNAIIYLVKKDSWKDLDKAIEFINHLRRIQNDFESSYLSNFDDDSRPYASAELLSLYHFAKSTEILGQYAIEGQPIEPEEKIKYHLSIAKEFAEKSCNITLVLLLQYVEGFALKMVRNTIWYSTRGINSWVSKFNKFIAKRENKAVFELLYPQRQSIVKEEIITTSSRAIVLTLPTSSGKTLIAEYRILYALNQFRSLNEKYGWIAYLVPTKALVNQVFTQLNHDLGPIGIKIEKASGAVELDGFEQHLVEEKGDNTDFDILVTTYEKMNLLVRQGLGTSKKRPLVLVVVDEAHNIGEKSRGLNLEMLLSTIKNDCEEVNFLLMTPDLSNSHDIVEWLAGDRGKVIKLDLDWWQPNERVVGAISLIGKGRNYDFVLKTLRTDKGTYSIGEEIPIIHKEKSETTKSQINSKIKIAYHLSSEVMNPDTPIIVLAAAVKDTYTIADFLYKTVNHNFEYDEDVDLLIRFVKSELGENFPLAKYLKKRIAIHSSALPDEIRLLIEDLMVKGKLQALVATTTIAQGINFPVSAVVISSYNYPFSGPMPSRDFWNLAGRVGRLGQKNMGWIGIASRDDNDLRDIAGYVKTSSEELMSQLVDAIDKALNYADENFGRWLWMDERWSTVFQYISHLRMEIADLNEFIRHLDEKLRGTLGYRQLPEEKKRFLRNKLRQYVESLDLSEAKKADETGFSTISLRQMISKLKKANITPYDWEKNQLFSEHNQAMKKLVGIMLGTYEIRKSFENIVSGESISHTTIARLIIHWVNGSNIVEIAQRVFPNVDEKGAIQKTTQALYKVIANAATWGLAALQKLPTSGIDWDSLSEIEKRKIANLPAYLYYGVNTDEGVLMRKNNVPRSIANRMGELFKEYNKIVNIFEVLSSDVTRWLDSQDASVWENAIPVNSNLSGEEYKKIWKKLNGG
ncbi:MAG TPA: DEAD/DEAH box helicase [candidate division WOR-3 bacterium]|uniref:DEAD/DEAH box helicase n=1 Tax=candidate division WOR-3 bacterium TaxID=2052148 RepID=A0A7V0LTX4_UNCW3|nr:DEAD/DEAH box helicase [candidate division WOR-3 bacterium]